MKIFTLRHSWPVILEAKRRESILLAMALVFAVFTACDSGSSSADPDPIAEVSSSSDDIRQCEEQSDDCDDTSSSSGEVSKNSSSSVDGDKNSSSSAKKEDSSSSAVKSSSSVTPKSSCSEEVKQSSSSVVASSSSVTSSETVKSSSSEYVPYNHYADLGSTVVSKSEYKQFTDTRNGRSYYYLTINGKDKDGNSASVTVMAENLNVGVMVDGKKDQSDNSKVERYCYGNDTTNCDKYGGLYQWAEMMQLPSECNTKSCADLIKPNHQGVCPEGWRLLTEDDFYIILHADGNRHGAEDVRATSFGGYNYSGYSLLGAGGNWAYKFERIDSATQWYYPIESVEYPDEGSPIATMSRSSTSVLSQNVYKTYGSSVRCVMVE
ncbi:MAG: FISUMP domain-containing protein [Fibrobacter sp.]|nr:FISUMP domain-containing protein [Fibrobacter sp.]